jgi:hypothetical protein
MTTPDPLLERLRRLPRAPLDDVAAARTLARAESAFASANTKAGGRSRVATTMGWLTRAWVPAALALWGALYAWGAVRELGRLFPAAPAQPAVAANHRGPDGFDTDAQFMLNAISKARAMTTATMTIVPLRPDTFRATSLSVAVPVCSEVSSDMDPSMQVVACNTRIPERVSRSAPQARCATVVFSGSRNPALCAGAADRSGRAAARSRGRRRRHQDARWFRRAGERRREQRRDEAERERVRR